jgi:hypothetical protein
VTPGRACPKCGTNNPGGAEYCNLCQQPMGGGAPAPGKPALRTAPMLLFTDAQRHNVRLSVILFALLLAVFTLLGAVKTPPFCWTIPVPLISTKSQSTVPLSCRVSTLMTS